MRKAASNISLYTAVALTVLIALYSLRYLSDGADAVDALSQTDALLEYLSGQEGTFWRDFSTSQKPLYHLREFAVVGHISAASIALLAGIIQLTLLSERKYHCCIVQAVTCMRSPQSSAWRLAHTFLLRSPWSAV